MRTKETANFVTYPCGCHTEYCYKVADRKVQSEQLYIHVKAWLKNKKSHTEPFSCKVFLCDRHSKQLKGLEQWKEGEEG